MAGNAAADDTGVLHGRTGERGEVRGRVAGLARARGREVCRPRILALH